MTMKSLLLRLALSEGASLAEIKQHVQDAAGGPAATDRSRQDVLSETDNLNGYTVLHCACDLLSDDQVSVPWGVLHYLVEAYPPALAIPTKQTKATPLYLAVSDSAPLLVVQLLARAFPPAVGMPNQDGVTPLLEACFKADDETYAAVIQYLVDAWPVACLLLDSTAQESPWDVAERHFQKSPSHRRRCNSSCGLLEYLATATSLAANALIEAVYQHSSILPSVVSSHIKQTVEGGNKMMTAASTSLLNRMTIRAMVGNPFVQRFLRDYDNQVLLNDIMAEKAMKRTGMNENLPMISNNNGGNTTSLVCVPKDPSLLPILSKVSGNLASEWIATNATDITVRNEMIKSRSDLFQLWATTTHRKTPSPQPSEHTAEESLTECREEDDEEEEDIIKKTVIRSDDEISPAAVVAQEHQPKSSPRATAVRKPQPLPAKTKSSSSSAAGFSLCSLFCCGFGAAQPSVSSQVL